MKRGKTLPVKCLLCGHTGCRKKGHNGSGSQRWGCENCGHIFVEKSRRSIRAIQNIIKNDPVGLDLEEFETPLHGFNRGEREV